MARSAGPREEASGEATRLKARADALRQAAALPGAGLGPLLDAALAELDGAVDALADAGGRGGDLAGDPAGGANAERRLLQAVFQQVPVPLFLLGLDGTVRRANSAAGQLVGSGPGYPTGKPFTAFVDLPFRAAVQSQVATVVRTGEVRVLRCGLLTADGVAEYEVAAGPVQARGDSGRLIVAVGAPAVARPGPAPDLAGPADQGTQPGDSALESATRRIDLVTSATRILLENVSRSESATMQRFARLLARELAAWLILDVERHQGLRRQLAVGPDDQASDDLARAVAAADPPPGSVPHQVHESGSSLLVAHAEDPGLLGEGPDGVPLLLRLGATSVLCVPVSDGERSYGALTLARLAGHGHFGMADVGLVEELGEQLALAIRADRELRHRTEIAEALQASLLPRRPRQIPGTEVAPSRRSSGTSSGPSPSRPGSSAWATSSELPDSWTWCGTEPGGGSAAATARARSSDGWSSGPTASCRRRP